MIYFLIPLLGTVIGSSLVFFIKEKLNAKVEKALLGFASGVMIAASIWSLLLPAFEMSQELGKYAFIKGLAGFLIGIFFLLALDEIIPHIHVLSKQEEGHHAKIYIPEGIIVALPLKNATKSTFKAFMFGTLSGVMETLSALVAFYIASFDFIMPYLLGFAAGAMIYVTTEELIPEMSLGKHSNIGTIALALGFALLIIMDSLL